MSIQDILSSLRSVVANSDWEGKENQWVRQLPGVHLSEVGARLVQQTLNGKMAESNGLGYKVISGEMRVEVKTATMGRVKGSPSFAWRQIRPSDPFTHLALVGVYPKNVRIFLFGRAEIPEGALKRIAGSPDDFQIVVTHVYEPSPWLSKHEYSVAP